VIKNKRFSFCCGLGLDALALALRVLALLTSLLHWPLYTFASGTVRMVGPDPSVLSSAPTRRRETRQCFAAVPRLCKEVSKYICVAQKITSHNSLRFLGCK